ncbi:MAG: helix-turn-helix domain-containing protein [Proteobacteria bacterium]|nr:helix-turn-helix domain-containing protein [Pseudomonadota bacterium]NOG60065.1 helix-turn-helix domain-containing protein [Pseudomonadota bacterium]
MIPITSAKTLGSALRKRRKSLGLTQIEAGQIFNIPQKTVSRTESGIASMDTLFKYMSALGLEMHLEPRDKSNAKKGLW